MPKLSIRRPLTVVITVEALATSPLSCYGCSWNKTPSIDSLAAKGVVWDRWISPVDAAPSSIDPASIDPAGRLIGRWLGDSRGTIREIAQQGSAVFVTDEPGVPIADDTFGFSRSILLQPSRTSAPAESTGQTALGQVFASALNEIEADTRLLWLHTGLLRSTWDAPIMEDQESDLDEQPPDEGSEFDAPSAEASEPPPLKLPETTEPPSVELSDDDDPDLLFAWMMRYAAQVRVLDEMIGYVNDVLRTRDLTMVLAGTSGFSIGENGWIGYGLGPLRSSEIRLPALVSVGGPIRVPTLRKATDLPLLLQRCTDGKPLVTPAEWCVTESEFLPLVRTESSRARHAITTPRWFFVADGDASATGEISEKLYLKPDDVSDVNDVSRLRRDVVEQFADQVENGEIPNT